jgi:hypothetical protein
MFIGIVSDSHDNLPLIDRAVRLLGDLGAEVILHAGDIVSPFAAKRFAESGLLVYAVYGNNDGEKEGLAKVLDVTPGPRRIELAGKTFVIAHSLAQIKDADKAGVDVIVHGHTHKPVIETGPPLIVNPGECGGWLYGRPTVAMLYTDDMNVEVLPL